MAFHVTQCPGCESTFNTSARILQSAAGKVRCGACLMVFEAAENFVDAVDIDEEENSSVFVGNDPSDYFDPSSFFTRSALTAPEDPVDAFGPAVIPETDSSEVAFPPDLPVEHEPHDAGLTDDYEHENQEFFTAIADELEAGTETAEPFDTNTGAEQSAPLEPLIPQRPSPEDIRLHATFSMIDRPLPAAPQADSLEEPKITEALAEPATPEATAAELSTPQEEIEIINLDDFDEFVETGEDSFSAVQEFTAGTTNLDDADAANGFSAVEGSYPVDDSFSAEDSFAAEGTFPAEDSNAIDESFTNPVADSIDQIDEVDTTAPTDTEHEMLAKNLYEEALAEAHLNEETLDEVTLSEVTLSEATRSEPSLSEVMPSEETFREDTLGQAIRNEVIPDEYTPDDELPVANTPDQDTLDIEVLEEKIPEAFGAEKAFYAETNDEAGLEETILEEATAVEVDNDSTESIRARAFRALLRDDEALEALPLESRSAIGKVLPPVELLAGREHNWGKRVLMTLACILLGATLGGQFLWQQFPVYSRTAQLRPVYEFACRVLSCELPVYSEISAIRSDNLVVRSHQSVEEALTVSLTFRNTAPFPQPFPVLILSFNSASNNIIALREFAPSEYLDSGLQNIALMPVMAPVQIDLDVIDPGADAVNYTVAYRRP